MGKRGGGKGKGRHIDKNGGYNKPGRVAPAKPAIPQGGQEMNPLNNPQPVQPKKPIYEPPKQPEKEVVITPIHSNNNQPTTPQVDPNKVSTELISDIIPEEGEDYGLTLPTIQASKSSPFYFDNENDGEPTVFSGHEAVVGNSEWHDFHKDIKGEFYDEAFAADDPRSLFGMKKCEDDYDANKIKHLNKLEWERLSYLYPDLEVVKDGITCHDIYQGAIGDCYLLSSIASVSEHPERIERLLIQRKRSPKGGYCVALCITGEFREFFLDDMIPTERGRIAFASSKEGELWSILIEKAYAKAYGGFWNMGSGGTSNNALFDLTGAPCEVVTFKDEQERRGLFKKLLEADKKKYIMNAGTKGSGENKGETGIISGHAYTLVSAHKLPNGDEVLKLRNPWGSGEWTGTYSDDSSKWTPALKSQLGWTDEDDGTFFMEVEDFMNEFEDASVCHYRDHYYLSSLPDFNQSNSFAIYQFNLEQSGEHYFGLSQPDKNMMPIDHTYGMLSVVIAQVVNGKMKYVGGKGYPKRDIWFMTNCKPGQYLAFVTTNWDNDNTEDFTFWCYGPKPVELQRVENQANIEQAQELFVETLKDYVRYGLTSGGEQEGRVGRVQPR